jgi:transcriptional regulator with XRE-family HTH domain
MATRERAHDRGTERGRDLNRAIGREIRLARHRLSLSLERVAGGAGISASELSRIERGLAPWVSVVVLARLCALVGLDLSVKAYPGARPMRDARHARMLARLKSALHPSLHWATEVPLPHVGDQRAWDALVRGGQWRYGVEAELNPIDGQALIRRTTLKRRDGDVDGVLLVVPDTRQGRTFRREYADLLSSELPIPGTLALRRLAAGDDPGGSALVTV